MINNKSWLSTTSRFEKIFWGTILFFLFLFILLHFFASRQFYQSKEKSRENPLPSRTILKEIEVIVDSDKMRYNLENNQTIALISDDLHHKIREINQTITTNSKELFSVAYSNIEKFLDFHYSVIGEYIELGNMATGKIEEHIQQRLFGDNFSIKMDSMLETIAKEHQENIKDHLQIIHNEASSGVDFSFNPKAIEHLHEDINQHFLLQQGKLGTLIVATLAAKITKAIASKLAAKQATLLATKAGTKIGIKSTASLSGASAGVLCGPFIWICSPVAAATLWFGTDAIVVSVDEHLNRDEFKQEIINALDQQKIKLTNKLQKHYNKAIEEFSKQAQQRYINTKVKVKKRMTIKELITQ